MAKQNTVKKGLNSNLKSNNVTGRKKTLAITTLAFAVVGVVLLIRSFAATTVISLNLATALNNTPGLVGNNATIVTESDTSQKKATSVQYVDLKYDKTNPKYYYGSVKYSVKLNTGLYELCSTLKPSVAGTEGALAVYKTPVNNSGYSSTAITFMSENTAAPNTVFSAGGATRFGLNEQKKVCVAFAVPTADNGTSFDMELYSANGTWRASDLSLSLNSRAELTSSALVKAAEGGYQVQIPPSDSVSIYGGRGKTVKAVDDTVNGVSQKVVEFTGMTGVGGANVQFSRGSYPAGSIDYTKKYKACVSVKAVEINANNKYLLYALDNNSVPQQVVAPTAADAQYNTKCLPNIVPVAGRGIAVTFGNYPGSVGSWRIVDAWLEQQ